ncbi:MAG TPA: hypothetical protein VFB67_11450 [Candidatus Polarisedimenticolaceae bacterium]|nr:hypothetical protein [Candidatus Polarisedimenticolaceae bacterium]
MPHSAAESSTDGTTPRLTWKDLAGVAPALRLPGRNLSKADVLLYRLDGRGIAVKDYSARPLLARQTVGRLMVGRECRAYEAAGDCPGIARFLGRLGPFALATAWIEAVPLAEMPAGSVHPALFDRLDAVIEALHARGVAIADLHHRDVLVRGEEVHVVDFAAACVLGPRPGALRRRLFARLAAQDRLAAARMRARFTGGSESEALSRIDPTAVRLWGAGRRVKEAWDRLRGRRA